MKKHISKLILMGIILVFIFKSNILAENKFEDGQVLGNILEDLGGRQLEEDISFNGTINERFLCKDEMDYLGEMFKERIGLVGIEIDPLIENTPLEESFYTKSVIFEEDYGQINYSGMDKDNNKILIFLSSYLDIEKDSGETYLYVNYIKEEQFSEKNAIIDVIRDIYDEFGQSVEITTCILGDFSGELGYNNVEEKIKYISKEYNIESQECFINDNLYSYSMYTPLIKEVLLIGNMKMNLNLAISYNEYDDKTYIIMGTPIIANGY